MEQDTNTNAPGDAAIKHNAKGLKIVTAVAFIAAVCGIGFGIYGMIKPSNAPSDSQNAPTADSLEPSAYEARDLVYKTLRLLGSRNGLSAEDHYDRSSGEFMVYDGYMPIGRLLNNELDNDLKTYITLETTMLDKEKYCSQWDNGVKADINAALGQQAESIDFGNTQFDCISYDKAKDDHHDLWGEDISKTTTMTNDLVYGANTDAYYYHILGGRGGACSDFVVGKISDINKDQDYAHVGFNAGSFVTCMGQAGELYASIGGEDLYKTIEQEDVSFEDLNLTENSYESFQQYRFSFKKNSDDIYSFVSAEKM